MYQNRVIASLIKLLVEPCSKQINDMVNVFDMESNNKCFVMNLS